MDSSLGVTRSNLPNGQLLRNDVRIDWEWADGHMQAIYNALKQNALHIINIKTASPTKDLKQATDIIITVQSGDVAVRIRRSAYRMRFKDLTIRSRRISGARTEIDKIRAGWARYYLYCWSDGKGGLLDWIFIDLDKVRKAQLLENRKETSNRDGRTWFVSISHQELKSRDCIISEKYEQKETLIESRKSWAEIYQEEKQKMTPVIASLTWRILVSHAAIHCKHLEETDRTILLMSASLHKTKDIKQWAKMQITELLEGAKELETRFNQNAALWSTAQNATRKSIERLALAGFRLLNVQNVTGSKTK